GAFVKYATTDGDAPSTAGVEGLTVVSSIIWGKLKGKLTRHTLDNQFSKSAIAQNSSGQLCKNQRKATRAAKSRCTLVVKELLRRYAGNMHQIKHGLPQVLNATVGCYYGDCSRCSCVGGVSGNQQLVVPLCLFRYTWDNWTLNG
ncbi:hypothetical protein MAR_013882, partial [Mya arenaria]